LKEALIDPLAETRDHLQRELEKVVEQFNHADLRIPTPLQLSPQGGCWSQKEPLLLFVSFSFLTDRQL